MNSRIVFDIEADGLKPTRIWCVVCYDTELHVFVNREDFAKYVQQNPDADWYAHNGIGYDYPVLERLWGIKIPEEHAMDTLVLSRLADPGKKGGHSLDAWGERMGFRKGAHYDFSRYTPEMLEYCKRDVAVTIKVLERLDEQLEGYSEKSKKLEHQVARIIRRQMQCGWKLDTDKAKSLLVKMVDELQRLEDACRETFTPMAVAVKEVWPKRKKDGEWSKVGLNCLGANAVDIVGGCFTRIEWQDFNLGSRQQIGVRLQRAGWKPEKFTETGQPQCDEETLELVAERIPEAALIADYLTLQKRIGMVRSWLEHVDEDDRIRGYVNSNGAVTGRMTHSEPNMAQITSGRKIYGKEMRECFIAEEGYKIVGIDADGLELRILAHYMNDADYIKAVAEGNSDEGTDAHTMNQKAAGLPTRDHAKTFIYAFIYGAGAEKIGLIVGGSKNDGAALKRRFLKKTPALANLIGRIKKAASKGYVIALDGRRIEVDETYKAPNRLLQAGGAIVMKEFLVELDSYLQRHNVDYRFVGNIHDEVQAEVREKDVEKYTWIAEACMQKAGLNYGLRIPITGKATAGNNWSETH